MPNKSRLSFFLVVSFATALVLIAAWLAPPSAFDVDSHYYIDLAEGRLASVIKPFSSRILHPYFVGTLARAFHLEVDTSFLIVSVLSLIALISAVTLIARSYLPHYLIAALLATPFLIDLFQDYYLPDLFHAALLGLFFLSLFYKKLWPSLVLLFLLQLTRESTLLLALLFVIISISRGRWKAGLGAIAAAVLGILVTSYFASLGGPNIHQIGTILYLAAKVPYNFLKNIIGLVLWTNTFALNNPVKFPLEPIWKMSLPGWLPSGAIDSIGIYTFDLTYPLITANVLLTTFGILPTILLACLAGKPKRLIGSSPLWVAVGLLYGSLSFLLGTSLGASVGRLVGYGWPVFWIALPALLDLMPSLDRKFRLGLLACHLLAAWLPLAIGSLTSRSALLSLPMLCLSLAIHGFALWAALGRKGESKTLAGSA